MFLVVVFLFVLGECVQMIYTPNAAVVTNFPYYTRSILLSQYIDSIRSLTCHILDLRHLLVILFLHQIYQAN